MLANELTSSGAEGSALARHDAFQHCVPLGTGFAVRSGARCLPCAIGGGDKALSLASYTIHYVKLSFRGKVIAFYPIIPVTSDPPICSPKTAVFSLKC